jgi:hypothetical protein
MKELGRRETTQDIQAGWSILLQDPVGIFWVIRCGQFSMEVIKGEQYEVDVEYNEYWITNHTIQDPIWLWYDGEEDWPETRDSAYSQPATFVMLECIL